MTSLKRRTVASLIASYISQFSTSAANFAIKIVLARLLLPAEWGIYAEAMLVVLVADTFTDVGLSQHVMREKHRPYGNVLLIRLVLSVIAILLIETFADHLDFLSPKVIQPARVLAPLILLRAVGSIPRTYMDRELMVHRSLVPQLLGLVTMGSISILLAYKGLGVYALILGTLAQELVFSALMWIVVGRGMVIQLTFDHTKSLILGSRYLFLIAVVGFVLQQGDIAITGTILNPAQVGLYAMAYTIIALTSKLVETAIYRVVYPLFCQYADQVQALGRIYVTTTLAMVAIEAPIYFFLLFNSRFFVSVTLGEKWMPAAQLLAALSVAGIVNPFTTFGIEVLRATKRDKMLTIASVAGAASLMTFGSILTLRYGAMGMVAANYIVISGVVTVITLLKMIPTYIRDLTGKLMVVYAVSFSLAVASYFAFMGHGFFQNAMSMVAALVSWLIFYRAYGVRMVREMLELLDGHREYEAV